MRTTHIYQHYCKCVSVRQLASIQRYFFSEMFEKTVKWPQNRDGNSQNKQEFSSITQEMQNTRLCKSVVNL